MIESISNQVCQISERIWKETRQCIRSENYMRLIYTCRRWARVWKHISSSLTVGTPFKSIWHTSILGNPCNVQMLTVCVLKSIQQYAVCPVPSDSISSISRYLKLSPCFTGESFDSTGDERQFFGSAQHVLCSSSCTAPAVRGRVKAGRDQLQPGAGQGWGRCQMAWSI